jgi:hypothetical protein
VFVIGCKGIALSSNDALTVCVCPSVPMSLTVQMSVCLVCELGGAKRNPEETVERAGVSSGRLLVRMITRWKHMVIVWINCAGLQDRGRLRRNVYTHTIGDRVEGITLQGGEDEEEQGVYGVYQPALHDYPHHLLQCSRRPRDSSICRCARDFQNTRSDQYCHDSVSIMSKESTVG